VEIKRLDWDSAFFDTHVYSAEIDRFDNLDEVQNLTKPCLLYLFLNSEDEWHKRDLEMKGALFCGTRALYHKKLTYDRSGIESEMMVREYFGATNEDLESLAYRAGMFSRFYIDSKLRPCFKSFFREWVINSLNKTIADKIFVYEENGQFKAFASCAIKDDEGWLGLISVDESMQGSGIGSSLLGAVERFYLEMKVDNSFIVTQKENVQACSFYESMGYKIVNQVFTYHWWFDL
jgi:dTDP-4-amino-4,6-dideoxy-D-galactose acyltransferase